MPQHNRMLADIDHQELTNTAAAIFGLDIDLLRSSKRISWDDKDKRDMLIYCLWETGRLSNQGIGSLLGMTYSNVSRRVSLIKRRFAEDRKLGAEYNRYKSQIKV